MLLCLVTKLKPKIPKEFSKEFQKRLSAITGLAAYSITAPNNSLLCRCSKHDLLDENKPSPNVFTKKLHCFANFSETTTRSRGRGQSLDWVLASSVSGQHCPLLSLPTPLDRCSSAVKFTLEGPTCAIFPCTYPTTVFFFFTVSPFFMSLEIYTTTAAEQRERAATSSLLLLAAGAAPCALSGLSVVTIWG